MVHPPGAWVGLRTTPESSEPIRPTGQRSRTALLRLLIDLSILSVALWAAFLLRFEGRLSPEWLERAAFAWPLVVAIQYLAIRGFQVPRFQWSSVGMRELPAFCAAFALSTAVLLSFRFGFYALADTRPAFEYLVIPVSVILIDAALALMGLTGARAIHRLKREKLARKHGSAVGKRTILVGAGRGGYLLAREIQGRDELGITPVAFVDDDIGTHGKMVHGIPVVGTIEDIGKVARRYGASTALVTIASVGGGSMRRITRICKEAGLETKTIPRLYEILSGRVSISQIRDVAIEDLLGRQPVEIEDTVAPAVVGGRVALVTGAGGSIGSELCRQILAFGPTKLILLERSENALYEIHRELLSTTGGTELVPALADLLDPARVQEVFETHHPDVVFHAAAHKHVPIMEANPGEAIKNNLFGTKTVADLAHRFECERFVMISTDKAVHPTSVMGATKRLAELYVRDINGRSLVQFTAVRFGNVLGSSGSVIPLFHEQIAKGGPVTITHQDMERYFMTIPEASRLVLEAAGRGHGGEVMVLDMGEPIRIRTLAEQMIQLSGFDPEDIEIRYVGLRPGEKLYEELVHDPATLSRTDCHKIFVSTADMPEVDVGRILQLLEDLPSDPQAVRDLLQKVLPEYTPKPPDQVAPDDRRPVARRDVRSA